LKPDSAILGSTSDFQASDDVRLVKRWLEPQKYGRLIRSTTDAKGAKFDSECCAHWIVPPCTACASAPPAPS
jgi:hypothetical protein